MFSNHYSKHYHTQKLILVTPPIDYGLPSNSPYLGRFWFKPKPEIFHIDEIMKIGVVTRKNVSVTYPIHIRINSNLRYILDKIQVGLGSKFKLLESILLSKSFLVNDEKSIIVISNIPVSQDVTIPVSLNQNLEDEQPIHVGIGSGFTNKLPQIDVFSRKTLRDISNISLNVEEISDILPVLDKIIEKERKAKFKPVSKVKLKNVQSSKETQRISDEMESELRPIVSEIEKEFENHRTYQMVYNEYKTDVGNIIAPGMREIYMIGFKLIEEYASRTIEFTSKQADEMNSMIQDGIDSFWKKIRDLHDKALTPNNPVEIKKLKLVDSIIDDFIGTFVAWVTQISLGRGTMITLKQLSVEEGIRYAVVFITEEDDRVCELCYPLQGREFGADEEKPEIPLHPNCRCQYFPIQNKMVFAA